MTLLYIQWTSNRFNMAIVYRKHCLLSNFQNTWHHMSHRGVEYFRHKTLRGFHEFHHHGDLIHPTGHTGFMQVNIDMLSTCDGYYTIYVNKAFPRYDSALYHFQTVTSYKIMSTKLYFFSKKIQQLTSLWVLPTDFNLCFTGHPNISYPDSLRGTVYKKTPSQHAV